MWVPRPRSILAPGAASLVALVLISCGSSSENGTFGDGGTGTGDDSSAGTGNASGSSSGTGSGDDSSAGTGSGSGSSSGSGSGSGSSSGAGSSSGSGSGSGSSSGTGSSSGSGSGADAGPACTAAVSSGAIALTSNYLAASVIADGGYAYAYNDGHSTACLDSTAVCGTGTTAVADAAGTIWGAGVGFNLNQGQATSTNPNPTVNTYAATGTGITYALSNLPPQGMRIVIDNGGADYCVPIAAASGTVSWGSFNTKCWDNSGAFLTGAPTTATHILFQVTADAAATPFTLCVTHVAFSTTSPPPPDAGTGGGTGKGGCAWTGGPTSGNGELTCYYFGQGTATGGGCPSYKTYCGYCGTETGNNNGGTCTTGITDTVSNISTGYFAAFPVGTFGQGKYCGMCVNVTYGGKTITATIVDECATCTSGAHIDLNLSAAAALGVGQGGATGDPMNGVTWDAVACPVSGNIVAVFNNGSSGQVYFQNVAFPVASATAGGATGNQQSGFWNFGGLVAGKSVTLTDTLGHTVTGTIPTSSGGSIGAQFPATCN
jgi:hypothetical protein